IALTALVIGIPHGAVDHLTAIPELFSFKMAIFLVKYLVATGLAIWFLLQFPMFGFQLIVFCSTLHFGVGDTSFYMEIYHRSKRVNFPRVLFALAAGSTPVLIPLVNSKTHDALEAVNPKLIGWAGSFTNQVLIACILLNLTAVAVLLVRKIYWPVIDLLTLLALALLAPPLVAFALYFGLWHAVRHTARLTLEFGPSLRQHELGKPWRSLWLAVRAGLPAVVVVLAFSLWLAVFNSASVSGNFLWYLLVVTWALTVPHMALTARSDIKAMSGRI
ncbi:MAG: beta-carotene 15,15'-dioxygenase, Brp/Blh family, partial [Actinobacteria bacterium]|nr:beta-carotene 15,15'-dioxygenase, Brp/Blh family [Actinomycetota bacterium]